ncbi:MAG: hypothetical protein DCF21_02805 [Leptolyngbya sp.]|nr:MAG: hypothetical protein DCF21_02805 [Leptolyngbya sp.]
MFSMSCFQREAEIISWLSSVIFKVFNSGEVQAWLIGSIASGSIDPKDCDVLIMLKSSCISQLVKISLIWRKEFEERFGLSLHLTRITYDEVESCELFLNSVFNKPNIEIKS